MLILISVKNQIAVYKITLLLQFIPKFKHLMTEIVLFGIFIFVILYYNIYVYYFKIPQKL